MKLRLVLLSFLIVSCSANHIGKIIQYNDQTNNKISIENNPYWQHLDIEKDTVPGISLEKTKQFLQNRKPKKSLVVAIIDTEIDINHEQLKHSFWTNSKEILDNNIDDDNNGYVDDIHGWNFLGNKKGENLLYVNYEYVRIVRFFRDKFENKSRGQVLLEDIKDFEEYQNAKARLETDIKNSKLEKENLFKISKRYKKNLRHLDPFLSEKDLTIEKMDSLKRKQDSLASYINYISKWKKRGYNLQRIESRLKFSNNNIKKYLNIDFDERSLLKDDPNNILDTGYGNNLMSNNIDELYHGTQVAGVFHNVTSSEKYIYIQPISIAVNGDEQDKDIALAIRYAIDNGAKVINYSSGKSFSLHPEWIKEAFIYAEQKNVLIVLASGNAKQNIDNLEFKSYPEDFNKNNEEYISNCIVVGASGYELNNNLATQFSNYGRRNVDVFAPGQDLSTLNPKNKETVNSGTSLSTAVVSGIAALIRSYYPSLSASEVKQILMDSSVKYDILVDVPTKENPDQQLPFNELSKSGGIVNAYNAMLMAEEYVKNKKK